MSTFQVHGGNPLIGEVTISGSKHSVLAILGTILLLRGEVKFQNFPNIIDSQHMLKIIESLGANIYINNKEVFVRLDSVIFTEDQLWRVSQLRSSILFLGSILVRTGYVKIPIPGGDKLGIRPMDEFLHVLDQFGIKYSQSNNILEAYLTNILSSHRHIHLCSSRITYMGNNRTVLALIFAWANRGKTIIHDAVILPEIIEACIFLEEISGGYVTIDGLGTETLTVNSPGINAIHCRSVITSHVIGPDKCEYAFWIAAACLTKGDIMLNFPFSQKDFRNAMRWLRAKFLRNAQIPFEILGYGMYRINCSDNFYPQAFDLQSTAHELYGIAFDATPLLSTILFTSQGQGSYFCFRFGKERVKWVDGIEKLGGKYEVNSLGKLTVNGVDKLYADESYSFYGEDIRGASALLLLALATSGEPINVNGIQHIERGMEELSQKLYNVGGKFLILPE